MYNWSVDTKKLSKSPKEFEIWKLEQMINFGLNGEKIDQIQLQKHLDVLVLDPFKKNYLKFLLS